jgi:hypothetical protein
LYRPKALGLGGVVITLLIGWWLSDQSQNQGYLVDHSNGYHRIKITESTARGTTSRRIYLDSTLEGIAMVGSITSYLPGVTKLAEDVRELDSVLVIGGGAFSTPRYFKKVFPNAEVDVIELDPDVVQYGYQYMELDDLVNVYIGDGRNVLRSLDKKYDLIFNDAFRGYKNIPSHMTTIEFNRLVKAKLSDKGIYAINVRGYPSESYLAASLLRTLKNDFQYLSETGQNASNTITVASNQEILFGNPLADNFDEGMLLTDNRAPTEMLVVADVVRKKIGF